MLICLYVWTTSEKNVAGPNKHCHSFYPKITICFLIIHCHLPVLHKLKFFQTIMGLKWRYELFLVFPFQRMWVNYEVPDLINCYYPLIYSHVDFFRLILYYWTISKSLNFSKIYPLCSWVRKSCRLTSAAWDLLAIGFTT